MSNPVQTCILCDHFQFDGGDSGWSEYTPGEGYSIGCKEGIWTESGIGVYTRDVRAGMMKAQGCRRFKAIDLVELEKAVYPH